MEKIWICVYRDTVEEYSEDWDWNVSEILVTKEFAEQYFEECVQGKYFNNLEDFLNAYTGDDTEDFYEYAMKHNAVIDIKHW